MILTFSIFCQLKYPATFYELQSVIPTLSRPPFPPVSLFRSTPGEFISFKMQISHRYGKLTFSNALSITRLAYNTFTNKHFSYNFQVLLAFIDSNTSMTQNYVTFRRVSLYRHFKEYNEISFRSFVYYDTSVTRMEELKEGWRRGFGAYRRYY